MPADLNKARELFLHAVGKLPPDHWDGYVAAAAGGDAELQRQVRHLLQVHRDSGSFLDRPAAVEVTGAYSPNPAVGEPLGTVIGPYTLVRQIGEGGMGTVFLAEQSRPVRRTVALKVIRPGMDSRHVIARFEAERHALAIMDHVNIARVFDAGTTASGRPFFAMELVEGVSITQYCDDNHLAPRNRLELFVPVCQAIQHAHQKGIIHRDVKPSNVLVTLYDGKPVPKVIDFGVAKAIEQTLVERSLFTQFGTMVGTVEYMSPEQADTGGPGVDTRSDVYSLGVLLYELLTGSTPLSRKRLKEAAYGEILRMIREEEPPRPSTRLSDSGEALASISAQRKTEPAKLSKLMRGELDWIVMKALEKDRNRRYDSANGFAQDVQRYLADEPVEACPPSSSYRLGKFLRRNKGAVLAAALVMVALFGGGIGAAYGLIEARKQREVTSLWQLAEVARGEAETARDGETKARREAEAGRERLAAVEYGRTMQVALQEYRDNNVPATRALLATTRTDMRGWEWQYVNRLCHANLLALEGHSSAVLSAAFSPDGSHIVTASEDTTAKVWDGRTGAAVLTFKGHTGVVRSAAFSPDGSLVVTGGHDPVVRVWDARTGKEVLAIKGHAGAVHSVAFTPDGFRVVTGGQDRAARAWDAKTGGELIALKGHAGAVHSAAVSPDGSRIATGSADSTAKVWDARTGAELLTLTGHAGAVHSAAFSPDGSRVVTGGRDNTARVWDARTGIPVLAVKGHAGIVTSASFSPDGTRVVTGSHDRSVRVWDAKSGAEVLSLKGYTSEIATVAFSPDGNRLVTGSGESTARVWDAKTGAEYVVLKCHAAAVRSVAFSPDGSRLVTGGADNTAKVWDHNTGAELLVVSGRTGIVPMVAFSPDGARMVTGNSGRRPKAWRPETGAARVWDVKSGAELAALRGHAGDIWSAAFSPDGSRVVTASEDNTARVWDGATGTQVVALRGHAGAVHSAAFSPDGTRVVTGSSDGTARVWDARTGTAVRVLKGHTDTVYAAAYSPDGSRVVTGSADNTAKIWDLGSGTDLSTLKGHTSTVRSVVFSPDGSRVVTGSEDKSARLWDARTGAEVLALTGHVGTVYSVAFSPDGSRVATAGDTTVRIWDVRPVGERH